jgi:hypothetical protein
MAASLWLIEKCLYSAASGYFLSNGRAKAKTDRYLLNLHGIRFFLERSETSARLEVVSSFYMVEKGR